MNQESLVMKYVIIPVIKNTKRPIINQWQTITKSPYSKFCNGCNLGFQCGKNNGIVVVDVDVKHGKKECAEKFINMFNLHNVCKFVVKTTSGGYHFYFKYSGIKSCKPIFDGQKCIDFCSDGNFVVMPGSVIDKKSYECIKGSIDEVDEMSDILKNFFINWIESSQKRRVSIKEGKYMQDLNYNEDIELTDINLENLQIMLKSDKLIEYAGPTVKWMRITKILKKYNLIDLWDEWSKTCKEQYDRIKNMRKWKEANTSDIDCDLGYIQFLYNMSNGTHLEVIQNTIYEKISIEPTNTINISRRYLPSMKDDKMFIDREMKEILRHHCVLIKAPMGSGKTTLIKEHMQDRKDKFLSIVSRVSLADNQHKTFGSKYTHYGDRKGKSHDYMITTCDSLPHLDLTEMGNRIVYLDEISSLLHYITTADHLKNPREIFMNLVHVLQSAKQIICTDADMNDIVFKFFEMIGITYTFINNTYEAQTDSIHYCYNSETIFWETYVKMSKKGFTILCSDTKSKADVGYKMLLDAGVDEDLIWLISSDKTPLDKEKKLCDTTNWSNKYIIYTPSIVYGVDFMPDTSLPVFASVSGVTLNPIQITQQIFRCRKVKNIYSFIKRGPCKADFKGYNDAKKYYDNLCIEKFAFNNLIGLNYFSDIENSEIDAIFESIFIYHKLQDNLTTANFYKYITKFLAQRNIITQDVKHKSKEEKKEFMKHDNRVEMIDDAETVLADILDDKEVNTINPIVKRAQLLGFFDYKKEESKDLINKYKDIIINDGKFKSYLRAKFYIEFQENPDKIKERYTKAVEKGFEIKVRESALGKLEILRRIVHKDYQNFNDTFTLLKKLTRLNITEYNEITFYKVLKHIGVDCVESGRHVVNGTRKTGYHVNQEKLEFYRELMEIQNKAKDLRSLSMTNFIDIDTSALDC